MKASLKGMLLFAGVMAMTVGMAMMPERAQASYTKSSTPTFFLHGAGETSKTFGDTISRAQQRGAAKKAYTATVSSNGAVKISGKWTSKNPMVHIVFKNNRQGDVKVTAKWLATVLKKVDQKHNFKTYNFVAHSKGNNDFLNYLIRYGNPSGRLKTFVAVGGPFNGVLGWQGERPNQIKLLKSGKPTKAYPYYQYYLNNRSKLPKTAKVVNIYGDLKNGSDSDGIVSNQSSVALKYLVSGRVASYRQKQFTGRYASHANQTHSASVQNYLYNVLW